MSTSQPFGQQGLPRSAPLPVVIDFVNRLFQGRLNAMLDFTLTANAGSSTVTSNHIGSNTTILWMPQTAHASAEIAAGTIFCNPANNTLGTAIITHANNAQSDRLFRLLLIG